MLLNKIKTKIEIFKEKRLIFQEMPKKAPDIIKKTEAQKSAPKEETKQLKTKIDNSISEWEALTKESGHTSAFAPQIQAITEQAKSLKEQIPEEGDNLSGFKTQFDKLLSEMKNEIEEEEKRKKLLEQANSKQQTFNGAAEAGEKKFIEELTKDIDPKFKEIVANKIKDGLSRTKTVYKEKTEEYKNSIESAQNMQELTGLEQKLTALPKDMYSMLTASPQDLPEATKIAMDQKEYAAAATYFIDEAQRKAILKGKEVEEGSAMKTALDNWNKTISGYLEKGKLPEPAELINIVNQADHEITTSYIVDKVNKSLAEKGGSEKITFEQFQNLMQKFKSGQSGEIDPEIKKRMMKIINAVGNDPALSGLVNIHIEGGADAKKFSNFADTNKFTEMAKTAEDLKKSPLWNTPEVAKNRGTLEAFMAAQTNGSLEEFLKNPKNQEALNISDGPLNIILAYQRLNGMTGGDLSKLPKNALIGLRVQGQASGDKYRFSGFRVSSREKNKNIISAGTARITPTTEISAQKTKLTTDLPQNIPPQGQNTLPQSAPHLNMEKPAGFARLPKENPIEEKIDQETKKETLMALIEATETGENLTENQKMRIQQVGMIKTSIESILDDIKDTRTWGEWYNQFGDKVTVVGDHISTEDRKKAVEYCLNSLDELAQKIASDPNATVESLLDPKVKALLAKCAELKDGKKQITTYEPSEVAGGNGIKTVREIEFKDRLMDAQGKIKDAKNFEELQGQYLSLVEFLRDKKDYAAAQDLVEGTLLKKQFDEKRTQLAKKQKDECSDKAKAAINKRLTPEIYKQWREQGLTEEQQKTFIENMIKAEQERLENKIIAEYNNGLPFDKLTGYDQKIMLAYKDMMGTGEWCNLSDKTWDTIQEELIINAPLIIISGGTANVARGAATGATRAVIGAARFAKIAQAGIKGAEVSRAARALYWTGKGGALLAEGGAFELTHATLTGETSQALKEIMGSEQKSKEIYEKLPDWGKRVLWSSATLGVFHGTGKLGETFFKNKKGVLGKMVEDITDPAAKEVAKQLLIKGHLEAATMMLMNAAQAGAAGNLGEFKENFWDEMFHAYVTVGALKISGGVINAGTKSIKIRLEQKKDTKITKDTKISTTKPEEIQAKEKSTEIKKSPTLEEMRKLARETGEFLSELSGKAINSIKNIELKSKIEKINTLINKLGSIITASSEALNKAQEGTKKGLRTILGKIKTQLERLWQEKETLEVESAKREDSKKPDLPKEAENINIQETKSDELNKRERLSIDLEYIQPGQEIKMKDGTTMIVLKTIRNKMVVLKISDQGVEKRLIDKNKLAKDDFIKIKDIVETNYSTEKITKNAETIIRWNKLKEGDVIISKTSKNIVINVEGDNIETLKILYGNKPTGEKEYFSKITQKNLDDFKSMSVFSWVDSIEEPSPASRKIVEQEARQMKKVKQFQQNKDKFNPTEDTAEIKKTSIETKIKEVINIQNKFRALKENIECPLLTKELLADERFIPQEIIKVGETDFYMGNVFNTGKYLQSVVFVELGGVMYPRVFYKSFSDGGWRSCPGFKRSGIYSKGNDAHYTQETKSARELVVEIPDFQRAIFGFKLELAEVAEDLADRRTCEDCGG